MDASATPLVDPDGRALVLPAHPLPCRTATAQGERKSARATFVIDDQDMAA